MRGSTPDDRVSEPLRMVWGKILGEANCSSDQRPAISNKSRLSHEAFSLLANRYSLIAGRRSLPS
jgi:hypothetical protein